MASLTISTPIACPDSAFAFGARAYGYPSTQALAPQVNVATALNWWFSEADQGGAALDFSFFEIDFTAGLPAHSDTIAIAVYDPSAPQDVILNPVLPFPGPSARLEFKLGGVQALAPNVTSRIASTAAECARNFAAAYNTSALNGLTMAIALRKSEQPSTDPTQFSGVVRIRAKNPGSVQFKTQVSASGIAVSPFYIAGVANLATLPGDNGKINVDPVLGGQLITDYYIGANNDNEVVVTTVVDSLDATGGLYVEGAVPDPALEAPMVLAAGAAMVSDGTGGLEATVGVAPLTEMAAILQPTFLDGLLIYYTRPKLSKDPADLVNDGVRPSFPLLIHAIIQHHASIIGAKQATGFLSFENGNPLHGDTTTLNDGIRNVTLMFSTAPFSFLGTSGVSPAPISFEALVQANPTAMAEYVAGALNELFDTGDFKIRAVVDGAKVLFTNSQYGVVGNVSITQTGSGIMVLGGMSGGEDLSFLQPVGKPFLVSPAFVPASPDLLYEFGGYPNYIGCVVELVEGSTVTHELRFRKPRVNEVVLVLPNLPIRWMEETDESGNLVGKWTAISTWPQRGLQGQRVFETLDPDRVYDFWALIFGLMREEYSYDTERLLDLFDPDECPRQFLPFLGGAFGVDVDANAPESSQRESVRNAVPRHRARGTPLAVVLALRLLRYEGYATHVWVNAYGIGTDVIEMPFGFHSLMPSTRVTPAPVVLSMHIAAPSLPAGASGSTPVPPPAPVTNVIQRYVPSSFVAIHLNNADGSFLPAIDADVRARVAEFLKKTALPAHVQVRHYDSDFPAFADKVSVSDAFSTI